MHLFSQFRNVSEAQKSKAIKKLIEDSTPDYDFFLMVALSVLMATFGLLVNSVAIVIGSMLIAPILYPVLSLSLGMVMSDHKLMSRSILTLAKSVGVGVLVAFTATIFFSSRYEDATIEILARTDPSLLYFAVALISGIAISFALVRPQLSEALPGVAVSVALIPPISVIGIGLAKFDWGIISGSTVLFIMNIIGIVFASMVSFSMLNLYVKRKVADKAIEKEEVRVEKEEEKAEELEEEETKDEDTSLQDDAEDDIEGEK